MLEGPGARRAHAHPGPDAGGTQCPRGPRSPRTSVSWISRSLFRDSMKLSMAAAPLRHLYDMGTSGSCLWGSEWELGTGRAGSGPSPAVPAGSARQLCGGGHRVRHPLLHPQPRPWPFPISKHTQMQPQTYTQMLAHTQIYTHMNTQMHTHTDTHRCIQRCTHRCTHRLTHRCTHRRAHRCAHR